MAKSTKKTQEVANKSGLTPQGVNLKRRRGETDAEIIAGTGKADASGETLASAQLRKEKALADLRELEVAQKSGALIPLDHAVLAGANMAQMTRQRMMTIPNTLAALCAASTDEREVKDILDAEISKQLQHLSNEFLAAVDQDLPGGGASGSSSEEADGYPVGGSEPGSQ